MATISRFEDLEIWQLARIQAKEIFGLINDGIFSNDFELINQIKRSSGSVMDNIAEGFEKFSTKEFAQALVIAKGSNGEVRSQLYRAFDRKYITEDVLKIHLEKSEIIGSKIMTFIKYLNSSNYKNKATNATSASNLQRPTSNFQPKTSNF